MTDTWRKLQPLRVASGWSIDVNNLYRFEPTPENMEWFFGSILISGHHEQSGLCFDARYEPEGDPEGAYVLDFLRFRADRKTGDIELHELLGSRRTRSLQEFVAWIETFMFTRDPAHAG